MVNDNTKKSKSALRKALIFFIIFFTPFAFILIAKIGNHSFITLPYFGPKEVVNGDTIYHVIPEFEFTEINGKQFSSKQLEGKIYVAEFFQLESRLRLVVDNFEGEPDIEFISFSAHEKFSNLEKMAVYAEIIHADTSRWHFLSGDRQEIVNLACEGFFKGSQEKEKIEELISSYNVYVLIDKRGHVRGVYDGGNKREAIISEINRVRDGIRLLKKQEDKSYAGRQ